VTLIDGTGRPPVAGASVLIEEDRIHLISRGSISAPENTRRIDGTGKYLIPGLMDLHIHLQGSIEVTPEGLMTISNDRSKGVRALHSYLYSGVTSVFDAGNVPDYILGLRDDERSGKLVSPRIFATGAIVTYPGSHGSHEFGTQVDSWPEAIPALDAHIERRPDLLKLTFEERGWGARPMIPILPVDLMQRQRSRNSHDSSHLERIPGTTGDFRRHRHTGSPDYSGTRHRRFCKTDGCQENSDGDDTGNW
jgi:imidazolonepropionase-like amidohydrolase